MRRPSRRRSRPRGRSRSRRSRACCSVIWPAFRSASIAICLPGIASRVKRAATSATRPAPFVITTNWITTRIRNTTRPTITLPPTTNVPNAWITLPASPCRSTSRVTLTLIAEPEQRRQQEQRREGREVEGARHVHRRDQDHQRAGDVDGDEEVDQRARQRHEHHRDHDDDADRGQQVVVTEEELQRAAHGSATHLGGEGSGRFREAAAGGAAAKRRAFDSHSGTLIGVLARRLEHPRRGRDHDAFRRRPAVR